MNPGGSDAASAASQAPKLEALQAGDLVAEVVPAIGGSLAAFYTRGTPARPRRDWLRPASAEALRAGSPLGMASFPLVPWCNRIRDGRFVWEGRPVELAPNVDGSPHTIHGIGWQRGWQTLQRGEAWIELVLADAGDGAWPYPFTAVQRYELDGNGLTVTLALRNTGADRMPAGLGHHPYFLHRREGAGTTVRANVGAMWLADGEVMPTELSTSHPAVAALRTGMPLAGFDLDNNFVGFGHESRVGWPDGSGLRLVGASPLDHFVLYSPSDKDFFVMEAVSNCTDWINLRSRGHSPAETGGAALEPGATLRVLTRLLPEPPPG